MTRTALLLASLFTIACSTTTKTEGLLVGAAADKLDNIDGLSVYRENGRISALQAQHGVLVTDNTALDPGRCIA